MPDTLIKPTKKTVKDVVAFINIRMKLLTKGLVDGSGGYAQWRELSDVIAFIDSEDQALKVSGVVGGKQPCPECGDTLQFDNGTMTCTSCEFRVGTLSKICSKCGWIIRAKELHEGGGIECSNKNCDYWFCF